MAWTRAFTRSPCPICGHLQWCTATDDGRYVNCQRTRNDKPIINKTTGEVRGHLFKVGEDTSAAIRCAPAKKMADKASTAEILLKQRQCRSAVNPPRLIAHAKHLGVTVDSLNAVSIGWDAKCQAWTFPMVDASGRVVGLRYRRGGGAKWSLSGGSEGVFLPSSTGQKFSIICEGPTSAAAWWSLGFDVIGRPSCTGGTAIISDIVRAERRPVLIIADLDEPKPRPDGSHFYPGQDGARDLHRQLSAFVRCAWAICPVPKDGRDWIKRGATHAIVIEWMNKHVSRGTLSQPASVKLSA